MTTISAKQLTEISGGNTGPGDGYGWAPWSLLYQAGHAMGHWFGHWWYDNGECHESGCD